VRLRTFPGYGYFLSQGYTTWPENWNTTVIHSHRGPVIPNSKMHGCYNGVGLWFVEGIAGIRVHASESPPLTIRAGVDAGDLTWARGHRAALHGRAASAWAIGPSGFAHNVTVPANAVARVLIPCGAAGASESDVRESGKPLASAAGITVVGLETVNGVRYVAMEAGSGEYRFSSSWRRAPPGSIRKTDDTDSSETREEGHGAPHCPAIDWRNVPPPPPPTLRGEVAHTSRILTAGAYCHAGETGGTCGGYLDYGGPTCVLSANETLLCFFCGEKKIHSDDNNWADVVLRRSFDRGRTWQPLQVVASDNNASTPRREWKTYGNTAAVLDRSTGKIILLFDKNNT